MKIKPKFNVYYLSSVMIVGLCHNTKPEILGSFRLLSFNIFVGLYLNTYRKRNESKFT